MTTVPSKWSSGWCAGRTGGGRRRAGHTATAGPAASAPPFAVDDDDRALWGLWDGPQRTKFEHGLRLVTARLRRSGSASVAIAAVGGSRHDPAALSGVAHVLEHLVFRGTERWPSSMRLTSAIEEVGGTLDGYTHREATVYHCRLPRAHLRRALEVLFDMLRRPRLDAGDFDLERAVVLEEISQDADAPAVLAEESLDRLLWPRHPLARPPIGTRPTVRRLTLADVLSYWEAVYSPDRTIVTVAGDVQHETIVRLVGRLARGWKSAPPFSTRPPRQPATPRLRSRYASGPTAYIYAGVRAVASGDPLRPASELLSCALGELASSRLWAELRDQRGLAYDVGSDLVTYSDCGAARFWAGVPARRAAEAVECMIAQARSLSEGLRQEEFVRAQSYLVGELAMACETTEEMAHWLLFSELAHGRSVAPGAVRLAYERLRPADAGRAAAFWAPEHLVVAIASRAPRSTGKLAGLLSSSPAAAG